MKIAVLNGSPKGEQSVTLQYVKYIEKKYPQHEFTVLHVAQTVKQLESQPAAFAEVITAVEQADGVLWAFPLYVYMVNAQYKRFIELIWEKGAEQAFAGKYAALLSTSIHFFDYTAHNYMQGIGEDLNMQVFGSYSADMDDLLKENERVRLLTYAGQFFAAIEQGKPTFRTTRPVVGQTGEYIPQPDLAPMDLQGKRVGILAESVDTGNNLGRLVQQFQKLTNAEVIDLSTLDMKGGCTGCQRCSFDNECMYGDKDAVEQTYRRLGAYDIIIFAAAVRDRYFSARWKNFVDRRFFNTHQPLLPGRQLGYLVSGPLSELPNLRQIVEANAELDEAHLAGIVTDEFGPSAKIDEQLVALAARLVECSVQGYLKPNTFLGIGGRKLFRDAVWGKLRFVFQADHRYYKKHGMYDFPQKQYGDRVKNGIMMLMTKVPAVKKSIQTDMKKHMISAYQQVLRDK